MTEKSKVEIMRETAAKIAPLIGATYTTPDSEDVWRAFAETADGIQILFNQWRNKGEITAWLRRPGCHETKRLATIGANISAR